MPDQPVYAGVRPEGFRLQEEGPLFCKLNGVEVMGRDISVVCTNDAAVNSAVRAIIGTENKVDTSKEEVRFALVPRKVFLFNQETEERISFEGCLS